MQVFPKNTRSVFLIINNTTNKMCCTEVKSECFQIMKFYSRVTTNNLKIMINIVFLLLLTSPLYDKWAPERVKYRVRHRLKIFHLPFFSLSCPSITGSVSCRKPTARSGWLQRKHPHVTIPSSFPSRHSKTSKNPSALTHGEVNLGPESHIAVVFINSKIQNKN